MVSKTDADGYVTTYAYSSLDLVSAISYNGAKEAKFAYNKTGNLVRMDDWNGTTAFALDLLGQLKKVIDHKGHTVSYTYDEVGNQTSVLYPDGGKVENTYDEVYNLTQVKDPENQVHKYTYDDARRNTKLEYPNGWVEDYTYDAEGQLLKVVDTDPFQTFNRKPSLKFEYQYDAEGNMTYAYKRDTGDSDLKSTTTYTYDALNRLTGSKTGFPTNPNGNKSQSYTYDTLGNLVREVGPTEKDVDTYQYNELNQMVHKKECGYVQKITEIHNFGYAYDKRGNLTSQWEICSPTTQGPKNITVASYVYDETNRMVQGTNKTGEVSRYTYNGLGVRVGTEQIVKDNTHGYTDFHCETPSVETGIDKPEVVKTDYMIDYTRIGIDQRLLWKSEAGGYDYRYVYGLDALSVKVTGEGTNWWGQKIHQNVVKEYYHVDVRGSLVNMTDGFGRIAMRADYDDWGDLTHSDSITVNGGFRQLYLLDNYTGHEYDQVLELYYAKYRFYDPAERRFIAEDPVKDGSNWFAYCLDNPTTWSDPLGLKRILNPVNRPMPWVEEWQSINPVERVQNLPWRSMNALNVGTNKYYKLRDIWNKFPINPMGVLWNKKTRTGTFQTYAYEGKAAKIVYMVYDGMPSSTPIAGYGKPRSEADDYIGLPLYFHKGNAYIMRETLIDYFKKVWCEGYEDTTQPDNKPTTPEEQPETPEKPSQSATPAEPEKPATAPNPSESTTTQLSTYTDFLNALGMRESSNNYNAVNQYGYMGKYQMGKLALQDIGWMDSSGNWTTEAEKYGANSQATFVGNVGAQEAAIRLSHHKTWTYLDNNGSLSYVGQMMNGIEITESGLLGGAHLIGASGLYSALKAGDLKSIKDGNGVTAYEYVKLFAGYSVDEIK